MHLILKLARGGAEIMPTVAEKLDVKSGMAAAPAAAAAAGPAPGGRFQDFMTNCYAIVTGAP